MNELSRPVSLVHLEANVRSARTDEVAHEEPLEMQLDGPAFAVVMRTPGHDEELTAGFLWTEGVVRSLDEVLSLQHCTVVPTPEAEDNVMQVRLRTPIDLAQFRRNLFTGAHARGAGRDAGAAARRATGVLCDGRAPRGGVELERCTLMVSGRVSFELVQKAVAARVPVLAGILAPTSLAVRMAEGLGLTLVGFLREGSMNVYSHDARVR